MVTKDRKLLFHYLIVVSILANHFGRHKEGRADKSVRLLAGHRHQMRGDAEVRETNHTVAVAQQNVGGYSSDEVLVRERRERERERKR